MNVKQECKRIRNAMLWTPGERSQAEHKRSQVLAELVKQHGAQVYQQAELVHKALCDGGVPPYLVGQIDLIVASECLGKMYSGDVNQLSPIDMNNMVLAAMQSGLSWKAATAAVSDIFESLGLKTMVYMSDLAKIPPTSLDAQTPADSGRGTIYVPKVIYKSEMAEISATRADKLNQEQLEMLSRLTAAGVPEACTLTGKLYLEGTFGEKNQEKAYALLKKAADCGDMEAVATLADLAYGQDNKRAFALYSQPGVSGLDKERLKKFRNLKELKFFNRATLLMLVVLTVLLETAAIALGRMEFFGPHPIALLLLTLVNVAMLALAGYAWFRDRYLDLRPFGVAGMVMFFIYIVALI